MTSAVAPTLSSYSRYQSPRGQEWIKKSIEYYTKVMRIEDSPMSRKSHEQSRTAKRLYHAIQQVRSGNLNRAENIYRKTIRDINDLADTDECNNAELATTTLLLALVLQRMDNIGEARMVFHRFFRTVMSSAEKHPISECACTGKVLGAYALFEMKFGSIHRSIEVARRATQFDGDLSVLFEWKQFREAKHKISLPFKKNRVHSPTPCSFVDEVNLPTEQEDFRLRVYGLCEDDSCDVVKSSDMEPSVIYYGAKPPFGTNGKCMHDVPLRIHSSCVRCDAFSSRRCKTCKDRLEQSMKYIQEQGGAIIYFQPEHTSGLDTTSHSIQSDECAQYSVIPSILEDLGVESVRLVSTSPTKVRMLRELGVDVKGTVPLTARAPVTP